MPHMNNMERVRIPTTINNVSSIVDIMTSSFSCLRYTNPYTIHTKITINNMAHMGSILSPYNVLVPDI